MKSKIINMAVITSCFVLFTLPALAQIRGVFDGGPTPPAAPVDGGLSLLIAGGIGYGVKKIRENKRKKLQQDGLQDNK